MDLHDFAEDSWFRYRELDWRVLGWLPRGDTRITDLVADEREREVVDNIHGGALLAFDTLGILPRYDHEVAESHAWQWPECNPNWVDPWRSEDWYERLRQAGFTSGEIDALFGEEEDDTC